MAANKHYCQSQYTNDFLQCFCSYINDYDIKNLFYLAGIIIHALESHACDICIKCMLCQHLLDNKFMRATKLYTNVKNCSALKEPCHEVFHLILHRKQFFKVYNDYIVRNGSSKFIQQQVVVVK